MWRRVELVRTEASEEGVVSNFSVERIRGRGTALVLVYPEDTSDTFLQNVGSHKATGRHAPKDDILHSQRRENIRFQCKI
jgi:hypothetical protein